MKQYDVTIWGRKNSIVLSIKGRAVYHVVVDAANAKEARAAAWNEYKSKAIFGYGDYRFECEAV